MVWVQSVVNSKSYDVSKMDDPTHPVPTSNSIVQALQVITQVEAYQHRWMDASNVISLLNRYWLDLGVRYSLTAKKLNITVSRSPKFKLALDVWTENQTGLCRGVYRTTFGYYQVNVEKRESQFEM